MGASQNEDAESELLHLSGKRQRPRCKPVTVGVDSLRSAVAGLQEGAARSHSVVPICTTFTVAMKTPTTEPGGRPVLARAWGAPYAERSWWACNAVWLLLEIGQFLETV